MVMISRGNYIKPSEAKTGDIVTFKDSGIIEESTYKKVEGEEPKKTLVMSVELNGEEFNLRVNYTSSQTLSAAWGQDTEGWVGKSAVVTVEYSRQINHHIIYLSPSKVKPSAKTKEEEKGKGWGE